MYCEIVLVHATLVHDLQDTTRVSHISISLSCPSLRFLVRASEGGWNRTLSQRSSGRKVRERSRSSSCLADSIWLSTSFSNASKHLTSFFTLSWCSFCVQSSPRGECDGCGNNLVPICGLDSVLLHVIHLSSQQAHACNRVHSIFVLRKGTVGTQLLMGTNREMRRRELHSSRASSVRMYV